MKLSTIVLAMMAPLAVFAVATPEAEANPAALAEAEAFPEAHAEPIAEADADADAGPTYYPPPKPKPARPACQKKCYPKYAKHVKCPHAYPIWRVGKKCGRCCRKHH